MNLKVVEKILKEQKQPKFRLEQIKKAVFQDGVKNFSEISNLPKELRDLLDEKNKVLSFAVEKILTAKNKDSIKALLKLDDGEKIETVLISPKPGIWSTCISCQVGCPMNCAFCATGKMGFKRNLTGEEIADQVLFWKQYLKEKLDLKLSNIVYMGMGEPFLNWKNVLESLKILTDPKGMNFGSRSISISTVGIAGGLEKLIKDFPQINLAISLHFSENKDRGQFMPANKKLDLEKLKKELEKYFEKSNRKVFLEYIMFSKINDDLKNAQNLIDYIKSFKKSHLLHVNLIKYNSTDKRNNFKPANSDQTMQFRNYLLSRGVNCTVRKSLGAEIKGACGQLAQH